MTIQEKYTRYRKFSSEVFSVFCDRDNASFINANNIKILKTGDAKNIKLTIHYNKINNLTAEEINIIKDNDVILNLIELDSDDINNLNITDIKDYLIKAKAITLNIEWEHLENNISKINKLNDYNQKITINIKEDYKMKNRDYYIINNVKSHIIIPIHYAMWMDLNDIKNSNVLFDNGQTDYYKLEEIKKIKQYIKEIINDIYSNYEDLNEYEKFYLALEYSKSNWKFSVKGRINYSDGTYDYKKDETGHRYNSSLFRILKDKESVCAGMSSLFQLILNNPIISVNVNKVGGEYIPTKEGHIWINTLIDNKVYEQCLTVGKNNIFSKLNEKNYPYDVGEKFKMQKALGLPLEYSEIPNAAQYLSQSVKNKRKRRIIKLDTEQCDFDPKYNWEDISYIVEELSQLPCNNEDKTLIEEYIYRAIKLKFITQSNINNVIYNIKEYYDGININGKAIPVNKRTKPNEVITKIILKSKTNIIIEDYKNNIGRAVPIEIEKGWKKIDELLIEMITYLINNYPMSLNYSFDMYVGKKVDTLYSFGKPLKDCGIKEDISKDKIIRDLIRKRFNSEYEKKIIDEFSVINPSYPNMHKDFYEILKSICKIFENENNILVSAYKIKLETITNEYRDYRGIPDSEIDYIDLSGRIINK